MEKLLPVDIALQPGVDVGRTLGHLRGVAGDDGLAIPGEGNGYRRILSSRSEGYRFLGYSKRHSGKS